MLFLLFPDPSGNIQKRKLLDHGTSDERGKTQRKTTLDPMKSHESVYERTRKRRDTILSSQIPPCRRCGNNSNVLLSSVESMVEAEDKIWIVQVPVSTHALQQGWSGTFTGLFVYTKPADTDMVALLKVDQGNDSDR